MKINKEKLIDLIAFKINSEGMELKESIKFILEFRQEDIEEMELQKHDKKEFDDLIKGIKTKHKR